LFFDNSITIIVSTINPNQSDYALSFPKNAVTACSHDFYIVYVIYLGVTYNNQ